MPASVSSSTATKAAASLLVQTLPSGIDIPLEAHSIKRGYGAFVYRLGHGPLKAERRVRFPYALPLKINCLRKSAGGVQEKQVSPKGFFPWLTRLRIESNES